MGALATILDVYNHAFTFSPEESNALVGLCDLFFYTALPVFVLLFFFKLNVKMYGRYSDDSPFGPPINARLAWCIQESPCVFFSLYSLYEVSRVNAEAASASRGYEANVILLGLFLFHYTYRAFVYPIRMRNPSPMPILLMFSAFLFCSLNGYMQASSLVLWNNYHDYKHTFRFQFGVCVFIVGWLINQHSDNILINLRPKQRIRLLHERLPPKSPRDRYSRRSSDTGSVFGKYKIPQGGLFRWLSCPNLVGEMIEWIGFAIAGRSPANVAFALFTVCNLAPRCVAHHNWYKDLFKASYPKSRKALIPFVY